jgi:hypothetical protein
MVKVRHSKGVAIHTDPESCAGYCREAAREALTGVRTAANRVLWLASYSGDV